MFALLFFVLLIQFLTYWIFEPIASHLAHIFEIRQLPIILLLSFLLLFSAKNIEHD